MKHNYYVRLRNGLYITYTRAGTWKAEPKKEAKKMSHKIAVELMDCMLANYTPCYVEVRPDYETVENK